jgi:hypothetical protein
MNTPAPVPSDPYIMLANWAAASLIRAKAARIDGPWLLDA